MMCDMDQLSVSATEDRTPGVGRRDLGPVHPSTSRPDDNAPDRVAERIVVMEW
jgi:hypothetical protein